MNIFAPKAPFARSHRASSLLLPAVLGGAALLLAPIPGAHASLFGDDTAKAKEEMAPVADATLTRVATNLDQIELDIAASEKALRQGVGAESAADIDVAGYVSAQAALQKRLDDAASDLASIDKKQAYLQGSHKLDEKTDLLTSAEREKLGSLQGRRTADASRTGAMEAMIKMASTRKDDLAKAETHKLSRAKALADSQESQAAATASGANSNQAAYSGNTVAQATPPPEPPPQPTQTVIVSDPYYYPPTYYYGPGPYYYGRPYYGHPYYGPAIGLDFRFGGGHHH